MIIKILGSILVFDGLISLFVVEDKRLIYQIGRIIRCIIGIMLIIK